MSLADGLRGRVGERRFNGRRGLISTVGVAVLCILGGCGDGSSGFRPLYGSASLGGAATQEKLAKVDVAPIPGRVGQRIRNELIFQTTGGGKPATPQYRMDIAIREFKKSLRQEFRHAQMMWACTLATHYWERFNAALIGAPAPLRPRDPR